MNKFFSYPLLLCLSLGALIAALIVTVTFLSISFLDGYRVSVKKMELIAQTRYFQQKLDKERFMTEILNKVMKEELSANNIDDWKNNVQTRLNEQFGTNVAQILVVKLTENRQTSNDITLSMHKIAKLLFAHRYGGMNVKECRKFFDKNFVKSEAVIGTGDANLIALPNLFLEFPDGSSIAFPDNYKALFLPDKVFRSSALGINSLFVWGVLPAKFNSDGVYYVRFHDEAMSETLLVHKALERVAEKGIKAVMLHKGDIKSSVKKIPPYVIQALSGPTADVRETQSEMLVQTLTDKDWGSLITWTQLTNRSKSFDYVLKIVLFACLTMIISYVFWGLHKLFAELKVKSKLRSIFVISGGSAALAYVILGGGIFIADDYIQIISATQQMQTQQERFFNEFKGFIDSKNTQISHFVDTRLNTLPERDVINIELEALKKIRPKLFRLIASDSTFFINSINQFNPPSFELLTKTNSEFAEDKLLRLFRLGYDVENELKLLDKKIQSKELYKPDNYGYLFTDDEAITNRGKDIFALIAKLLCAKANEATGKIVHISQADEMKLEAIFGATGIFSEYGDFFEIALDAESDKLQSITAPDGIHFVYQTFLRDQNGIAQAMLFLRIPQQFLIEEFIEKNGLPANTRLINAESWTTDIRNYKLVYDEMPFLPSKVVPGDVFYGLYSNLGISSNELIGVYSPTFLNNLMLVTTISTDKILNRLSARRILIIVGGILILMTFIFISRKLTKTFVVPLNKFNDGITKMQMGKFNQILLFSDIYEFVELQNVYSRTIGHLQELNYAKTVQETFSPSDIFENSGFIIKGHSKMLNIVGGDYFDIINSSEMEVLVALGDVSGHGLPAAVVVAMAKAAIYFKSHEKSQPAATLSFLNQKLIQWLARFRMMTLFLCRIDLKSGKMIFSNGGQSYPVKVSPNGERKIIKQPSLPVGAMKKAKYSSEGEQLLPGETLFLYSDGIIEATNSAGEQFGYNRLYKSFSEIVQNEQINNFPENIFAQLTSYTGECNFEDDLTLLLIHRKK